MLRFQGGSRLRAGDRIWSRQVTGCIVGRQSSLVRAFHYASSVSTSAQGGHRMCNKSLTGTLVALLLVAGAGAASAQEVTPADRDRALQYLESTKKNVLEATKGLSQ